MPQVSVIVPNYNHAKYLVQRLDSIYAQTFQDFEIIILDDASIDNSKEVITPYLERINVRFEFNKSNSGSPFKQWLKGVRLARGEYIWIAESDDVADARFLETLVPMLDEDPKIGIAYCQSNIIGANGENLGVYQFSTDESDPERWMSPYTNDGRDETTRFLLWQNSIPNASGVLFRKTAYSLVGKTPEKYRLCGDWMVWVFMLKKFDISYTPLQLNFFRKHQTSVRETTCFARFIEEKYKVQQFVLHEFNVPRATRRELAKAKVHELLSRIRSAPTEERVNLTARTLYQFMPFFWMFPLTVIKVLKMRFFRFFTNWKSNKP